jgi:hypothetical protein
MAEYASRGVGNAALTTGIIGTSGFGLNLLSNLLTGMAGNGCCNSDNMAVNRYEASQNAKIAALETEVKLRDANFYTLSEMGKLRDYVDGRINGIEQEICQQRVYNATNNAAMNCMQGQIAQLYSLTKLVVPNGSICPGWGDVSVSITPAPTTGA